MSKSAVMLTCIQFFFFWSESMNGTDCWATKSLTCLWPTEGHAGRDPLQFSTQSLANLSVLIWGCLLLKNWRPPSLQSTAGCARDKFLCPLRYFKNILLTTKAYKTAYFLDSLQKSTWFSCICSHVHGDCEISQETVMNLRNNEMFTLVISDRLRVVNLN